MPPLIQPGANEMNKDKKRQLLTNPIVLFAWWVIAMIGIVSGFAFDEPLLTLVCGLSLGFVLGYSSCEDDHSRS